MVKTIHKNGYLKIQIFIEKNNHTDYKNLITFFENSILQSTKILFSNIHQYFVAMEKNEFFQSVFWTKLTSSPKTAGGGGDVNMVLSSDFSANQKLPYYMQRLAKLMLNKCWGGRS